MNSEHQLQAQTARHTAEIADILRRFEALGVDLKLLEAASLELVTGTAPIVASAKAQRRQAISIDPATTSVPGSMSAADKAKLDLLVTLAWTDVSSFSNSWVQAGGGTFEDPGYSKDAQGIVRLRGVLASGTIGLMAFTLPAGFRPAKEARYPCDSNAAYGRAGVATNGDVTPLAGSNASFWLSGICFQAA